MYSFDITIFKFRNWYFRTLLSLGADALEYYISLGTDTLEHPLSLWTDTVEHQYLYELIL